MRPHLRSAQLKPQRYADQRRGKPVRFVTLLNFYAILGGGRPADENSSCAILPAFPVKEPSLTQVQRAAFFVGG